MKYQRDFFSINALIDCAARGIVAAFIVTFLLGYVVIRGVEYLITNYSVEVKSK